MSIQIGDRLPEIELASLSGERYTRDKLTAKATHFILLRHLG